MGFPTDFDKAYQEMARAAFSSSFDKVEFLAAEMTPDELAAKGIDAEIIVYQGALNTKIGVKEELFSGRLGVSVEMTGIVAVVAHTGLVAQESPTGSGFGSKSVALCSEINTVVAQAGQSALAEFVSSSVKAAQGGVESWRASKTTGL